MTTMKLTVERTRRVTEEVTTEVTFPVYLAEYESHYAGTLPYTTEEAFYRVNADGTVLSVKYVEEQGASPREECWAISKGAPSREDWLRLLDTSSSRTGAAEFEAALAKARAFIGEALQR